jgi:hypothetical protein
MKDETPLGATLLSKAKLLESLCRKKTWLNDIQNSASKYYDATFPLPIYLGSSCRPLWISTEIEAWIASAAQRSRCPKTLHAAEPVREQADKQSIHRIRLGIGLQRLLAARTDPVQATVVKTLVLRNKHLPNGVADDSELLGNAEPQGETLSRLKPGFPRLDELSRQRE